ncbi:hypothetical protein SELMODRAFT_421386 [Selaginella moellendorffii]|uniref:Uncharacterized protein n=1 Tax=Selaginella moellendorffii TaxID=88036 RepID=D8SF40_SELML|nr:hypothetical protein SELMODRAFT_421386 [Selaginella moellendorffii]
MEKRKRVSCESFPRAQNADWSALPLDVLLKVYQIVVSSYENLDEFRFVLALSGVCRSWRDHTKWFEGVSISCPEMGRCCKHKAELDECDCVQTSVSMVTSRLQKITSFCFCSTSVKVDSLNWTKLLGSSLLELEIGWNVTFKTLQRISIECINLQELRIDGLEVAGEDFGQITTGLCVLPELHTLHLDLTVPVPQQDQALNRFLRQCPNLKHIYLKLHDDYGNPDINDDAMGSTLKRLQTPESMLSSSRSRPEFLASFNMVDEYQELELGLGFLAKLEFDYVEDEILGQCLLRIHRLFVSESPEEEEELDLRPDLGRAAHAVEKVINLCRVQRVTLVTSDRAVERSFDPASSFDMESLVEFYKQH